MKERLMIHLISSVGIPAVAKTIIVLGHLHILHTCC
jgi:hypothetical protein